MMTPTTLFMPLLDDGTGVWRPVAAEHLEDGTYRIIGPVPESETWAFAPGSIVRSRPHIFIDGEMALVATPLP